MLSVAEALARITAAFAPLPGETVGLGEALGRVLAEDLAAREHCCCRLGAQDGNIQSSSLVFGFFGLGRCGLGRAFDNRLKDVGFFIEHLENLQSARALRMRTRQEQEEVFLSPGLGGDLGYGLEIAQDVFGGCQAILFCFGLTPPSEARGLDAALQPTISRFDQLSQRARLPFQSFGIG